MIHTGDAIEVMRGMPADSVDAVVTDPPYGLEFMGKGWDKFGAGVEAFSDSDYGKDGNTFGQTGGVHVRFGKPGASFQAWCEAWGREALRVTKPGGYLLAFGGTRTHHRLVCGLEDAGWIIRDELDWIYACLSDDTEILTRRGWLPYNEVSTNDDALAFDSSTGTLRWELIRAVHEYRHTGDMVWLHGAGTDQLVTLNHRLVLMDGQGVDQVPGVRDGVLAALRPPSPIQGPGLLDAMQRDATHPRPSVSAGAVMERGAQSEGSRGNAWVAQLGMEGRRYRVQEARELFGSALRESAGVGEADGPQGRLHHGAPSTGGRALRLPDDQGRGRESREPRPDRQPSREPDPLAVEPRSQAVRVEPAGDGWRLVPSGPVSAAVVGYAGVVWCVTVPSGAFVARRRGLAFVTGNSGFPKGRANLKPAHEPIVLARKPGPLRPLGIDATRIPSEAIGARAYADPAKGTGASIRVGAHLDAQEMRRRQDAAYDRQEQMGRWPSNLLLSDPELFDEPNPYVVGSGATTQSRASDYDWGDSGNDNPTRIAHNIKSGVHFEDSGGYSRFFIVPKADRADREPVLRGQLEEQEQVPTMGAWPNDVPAKSGGLLRENAHPTVKPTDLMRHLIRLVTPSGGTVLDPFLGSGSTAIAAELEGFPWIGIEKEPEYVAIAEARLNGTQRGLGLDVPLVGEPRKASLNKPTEWKSDGDGIGQRVSYHNGVGAREAGTIRGAYDGHLMQPKPKKLTADTAPVWGDEEPAA